MLQIKHSLREREREREYPTEPKSRVGDDIACIAGGLRGCESVKKPSLRHAFRIHADRQLCRLEPTMLVESSRESIQFTENFEKPPPILVPEAIM